ncbi:MAG: hypothetical protein ACRD96_07925, partial [Bryobacteraceae bacterium]
AVLHLNFTVVDASNPVRRGEIVAVYLCGLGAVSPALADGAPGSSDLATLNRTIQTPIVRVGAKIAEVLFSGAAPGLAGLYQLTIRIPDTAPLGPAIPLAIETAEHFHDQVDIPITP